MVTDEERREVAARLREAVEIMKSDQPATHDGFGPAIGISIGCLDDSAQAIMARLADIIDPDAGWHVFSDEYPPKGRPVLCKGCRGTYYVGWGVYYNDGHEVGRVWVPRSEQYRKPEKWREIPDAN